MPGRFGQGFAGMIYLPTLSYLPETSRPADGSSPYPQIFYGTLLQRTKRRINGGVMLLPLRPITTNG